MLVVLGRPGLQDLVGNSWSLFSYAQIKIACIGAMDWRKASDMMKAWKGENQGKRLENDIEAFMDEDDEDGSDHADESAGS